MELKRILFSFLIVVFLFAYIASDSFGYIRYARVFPFVSLRIIYGPQISFEEPCSKMAKVEIYHYSDGTVACVKIYYKNLGVATYFNILKIEFNTEEAGYIQGMNEIEVLGLSI